MSTLLEKLKQKIQYDKLTVSFSIEGRDPNGLKKFMQFSATVSHPPTTENNPICQGWSPHEMPIVKALVSKQVVAAVYNDAVKHGVFTSGAALGDLRQILDGFDKDIARRVEVVSNVD